jgi:hypothetical protein
MKKQGILTNSILDSGFILSFDALNAQKFLA